MKRPIRTSAAPKPIGPYSQAVESGDLVFTAGQIALDPATGTLIDGTVDDEVEQALDNLEAVLEAAGLDLDAVVKTTVFLTNLADGPAVTAIYSRRFNDPYPARSTVQVAALPANARIEIEAIAVRPPKP